MSKRMIAGGVLGALLAAGPAASGEVLLVDRPLTAAEEQRLKPGDEFRECPGCPRMVVIPAGTFLMGSAEGEPGRDTDEGPQQEVTIARPYAIGKYELTFEEWDACVTAKGCNGWRPSDQGWGRGRNPVILISWQDAKAYTSWLSHLTGKPYRLPSEAEWERAARGGSTSQFWWGPAISTSQANFDGTVPYAGTRRGEMRGRVVPVDSFAPNAFGLYNVHGNVWEWVEDCWHRRYADMPETVRRTGAAWTSPDCKDRVFRGGSWADAANVVRAANRGRYESFIRNTSSGVRVARSLGP
jgi:formylglycine-generating enzyme required for sulfatase activity